MRICEQVLLRAGFVDLTNEIQAKGVSVSALMVVRCCMQGYATGVA